MSTPTLNINDINHPSYQNASYRDHIDQLTKVQAIYDGSDTATPYLNKFVREDDTAFTYRVSNLTLLNLVKRTNTSSKNMIFRKPVEVEGALTDEEEATLNELAMEVVDYIIRDGYTYLVVDAPQYDDSVATKADQVSQGLLPYMYTVRRHLVPNFKMNDNETFEHFTVNEDYVSNAGVFGDEYATQQRVFKSDGTVEIYREGSIIEVISTGMNRVPVFKVGTEDIPWLYDLCKINISHMNRRSELNRYLRIAATPIPVMYGAQTDDTAITIGVDQVVQFNNISEGDFQWREMTGSSTNLLQDDLVKLEEDMLKEAIALTSDKEAQAKTATQVSSEQTEGESKLSNIAQQAEKGINEALQLFSEMGGYTATITINRDYDSNVLTPEQINTYLTMYREGAIALDTLWDVLITGEILPKDFDIEKEKTALVAGMGVEPTPIDEV